MVADLSAWVNGTEQGHNLKAWCRENGYKPSTIRNLKSRPECKHGEGLRVERWDPLWESNRLDGDG